MRSCSVVALIPAIFSSAMAFVMPLTVPKSPEIRAGMAVMSANISTCLVGEGRRRRQRSDRDAGGRSREHVSGVEQRLGVRDRFPIRQTAEILDQPKDAHGHDWPSPRRDFRQNRSRVHAYLSDK